MVKVVVADLSGTMCHEMVGASGEKMCIKSSGKCNTISHKVLAAFKPVNISQSGSYVLISVTGHGDGVWLSQLATFEAAGQKWLGAWKDDVCPREVWMELLRTASSTKDKEVIEFSKELAKQNH